MDSVNNQEQVEETSFSGEGRSAEEESSAGLARVDTTMEDAPINDEDCTTVCTPLPDDSDAVDRIKAPPVCVDSTLQMEAMSTEELQQYVFPLGSIFPACASSTSTNTAPGSNWSRSLIASTGTIATTNTPLPRTVTTTTAHDPQFFPLPAAAAARVPVSVISVSSNNSCGDSHTLSSDELMDITSINKAGVVPHSAIARPPALDRDVSVHLNAKVALRKTSRQGRSSQRWVSASLVGGTASYPSTHSQSVSGETSSVASAYHHEPVMRLVTGCVPILRSGMILFISASRKPEWILPKGGWEQDETMEESAVRECFEEAGCLGTLGPALSPIQHETRKAKKRRLENEQFLEQHCPNQAEAKIPKDVVATSEEKPKASTNSMASADPTIDTMHATPNEADWPKNKTPEFSTEIGVTTEETASHGGAATPAPVVLSAEALSRIRQLSQNRGSGHQTDNETMSVGSTLSSTYSHVQMTLFPLYVRTIVGDWPEKGRFRKAVGIDEAIAMLDSRSELQAALQEVKELGLHLVSDIAQDAAAAAPIGEQTSMEEPI